MKQLLTYALRNPRVLRWLRVAWKKYGISIHDDLQPALTDIAGSSIPEIGPLDSICSSKQGVRINILIPAVSRRNTFGGVATAASIFLRLANKFDDVRIVVTDEIFTGEDFGVSELGAFRRVEMGDDVAGRTIVWAGDRYEKSLSLRDGDVFVVTAWWTAYNGFRLLDEQNRIFGNKDRKIIYIIQDFEPGFYAWSSRYLLAMSTYQRPASTIAIINTAWLDEYLKAEGANFYKKYVFEPLLPSGLKPSLRAVVSAKKERVLLIYGRPGVHRNAFELIVSALKIWACDGRVGRAGWQVLSLGEQHADIELGGGVVIKSLGKRSMSEYGDLLVRASLGVSLMVSPHPSYPPLEMAAFGLGVVTNRFGNKNLSLAHPSIFTPERSDPASLAMAIHWQESLFSIDNGVFVNKKTMFSWPYCENDGEDSLGFLEEVVADIC